MKSYQRTLQIERADTTSGDFPMVLATSGEASDGHIINVRGIDAADSIPLQVDHSSSAMDTVGQISSFEVEATRGKPALLRATGHIRLTGEGEALALRRDLLDAVSVGDVNSMSLRWEGTQTVERTSLPKDHPAYVARNEKDPRRRYGLYFEKSRALEGSLVAIPADRAAIIGRSEAASSESLGAFWRSFVEDTDPVPSRMDEIVSDLERRLAAWEERDARRALEEAAPSVREEVPAEITNQQTIEHLQQEFERIFHWMEEENISTFDQLERSLKNGRIKRTDPRG